MEYTNQQLRKLLVPLIIEQVLCITIGMVDTVMVASVGESAVSGISLVDTIGFLISGMLSALAAGGAVVVAQFIGHRNTERIARASNQLFLSGIAISTFFMIIAIALNEQILTGIYGDIDASVMANARIYFYITALSYPLLSIYNSGASLFRAVGNSKASMYISVIANIVNAIGNAILIYGFQMGVAGAAWSTLFSRVISCVVIVILVLRHSDLAVERKFVVDLDMIKRILYIGIPNGLENSIFQIGKILVSRLIATFGTVAITANAVTCNVSGLQLIPVNAIGIAMITLVGQAVGAGDKKLAKRYVIKLMKVSYACVAVIGVVMFAFADQICAIYNLTPETTELVVWMLRYNCICVMLIHPVAFAMSNALRAANDVKFTMYVAILSMWICRIALAYLFGQYMGFGVAGVWVAMTVDWLVRGICFTWRIASGRWEKYMHRAQL